MLTPEELEEIQDLARRGMAIRAIARKLGRDVKAIRRALQRAPQKPPSSSKLEAFKPAIQEKLAQGLTGRRILREIRELGYTGGRTLLNEHLRTLRPPAKAPKRAVRRFETRPGKEAQMDWSPFRILIGGRETVVHCFSMILGCSRRMFVAFYRNERLPTLLHGHVEAFGYLGGLCEKLVYDNQTTVTLGRVGGKPLWNPTFLEFARHYGFTPWTCKVRDPKRKGKIERPFPYIEKDFLKGRTFTSWDDLAAQRLSWLDGVANVRQHTTIARRIDEAYAEEKPLLMALPAVPYPTDRREVRKVGVDATVLVDGTFYPVPEKLIGQHVSVRVWPMRVEVTDAAGAAVAAHAVPDRPTRLSPEWPSSSTHAASVSRTVLEARFLAHFPQAADFLDGLKRRMNALTPIHLRQIERLVALYGEERTRLAIERAREYRNFNAPALTRILEKAHPHIVPEAPIEPIAADPAALGALDDVDSGSPRDYDFDSREATDAEEA